MKGIKLIISAIIVFMFDGDAISNSAPEKPNIIIFLTDDLGYGDLGCYGNPIIKTPNIDQFATEGVRLTDCHSGGTVCSPSRAALLTGRNPYRSGFYDILGNWNAYLKDEEITIPELLKPAGYSSCFVGKWHLSHLDNKKRNEPSVGDQGFDYWFATTLNAFEGPANPKKFIRNGTAVGEVKGPYADVIVEEACKWLNDNKSRPFFLMVSTHEPHTPLDPPLEFSKQYDNERVDRLEKTIKYGGVGRPDGISKNKDEYYGTVSQMDQAFGRLMKYIDSAGLRNNTIVIFTSDNGPETPEYNNHFYK
jgi:arylsulfatase A